MYCNVVRNMSSGIQTRRGDTMKEPCTEEKNNGYVVFKWKSSDRIGNYRKGEGYSAPRPLYGRLRTERRRERFFLHFGYFFMDDTQHPQPPKMSSTLCLVSAFSYVVFPYSTTTVQLFLSFLVNQTRDPIHPCYQDTCTAEAFFHNTEKTRGKNVDRIWFKFWYEKLLPRILYDINICVFPCICKNVPQYMNLLTNLVHIS